MLNSREAASLTLLLLVVVVAVAKSNDRRKLVNYCTQVLRAALHPKVVLVCATYFVIVAALTCVAAWIGLWDASLLKDTVVLSLFTGIPLSISKPLEVDNGEQLLLEAMRGVLGISAFAAAYVNLAPLPYIPELLLQALATILVIGVEFGKRNSSLVPAVTLFKWIQGIIGVCLFVWVGSQLTHAYDSYRWVQQLKSFAFSVYLPLAMIPFAYTLGVVAGVESKMVLLPIHNKQIKRSVKLAVVAGFRGRLLYVRAFCGQWLIDAANSESYHEACAVMSRYRQVVRANAQLNRKRKRLLRKLAGTQGRDEGGRWIDRREFHETKQALNRLYYFQMGLYRNKGQCYHSDENILFPIGGFQGLPDPPDVHLAIRSDAQAWYAWRQTVGGCCLAVGGSSDVDVHWRYSNELAPDSFPGEGGSGWMDQNQGAGNVDWAFDDAPFPMC